MFLREKLSDAAPNTAISATPAACAAANPIMFGTSTG